MWSDDIQTGERHSYLHTIIQFQSFTCQPVYGCSLRPKFYCQDQVLATQRFMEINKTSVSQRWCSPEQARLSQIVPVNQGECNLCYQENQKGITEISGDKEKIAVEL